MKLSEYLNLVTSDRYYYEKDRLLRLAEQLEKENDELNHKVGNLLEQLEENNEILKRDYGVGFSTVEENEYFLEKFKDKQ